MECVYKHLTKHFVHMDEYMQSSFSLEKEDNPEEILIESFMFIQQVKLEILEERLGDD